MKLFRKPGARSEAGARDAGSRAAGLPERARGGDVARARRGGQVSQGGRGAQLVRGSRQRRLLSKAMQLEEEALPGFLRPALVLIGLLVLGGIAWASFVDITEVTATSGEVVPSGSVKVVQHPAGGVVAEIPVAERELVEAGQPLLRLDAAEARSQLEQVRTRRASLRLRAARLDAFAKGETPDLEAVAPDHPERVADQREIWRNQVTERESRLDVLAQQVRQRRQELAQQRDALKTARRQQELIGQLLAMRERMAERRLISQVELMETRRADATADGEVARLENEILSSEEALAEARSRRENVADRMRQEALDELGQVNAQLAEVETELARAELRVERLALLAPVRGLVQDLRVTTEGQVIKPSETVMKIVPVDDDLEVEVRIPTGDIGHVNAGQPVTVKVTSYNYNRFGSIDGTLRKVSATSLLDEDNQPYFRGWVALSRNHLGDSPGQYRVLPGMSVQADIITGERTLLQYLVKPVADALDSAFHER